MGVKRRLHELEQAVGASVNGPYERFSSGLYKAISECETRAVESARYLASGYTDKSIGLVNERMDDIQEEMTLVDRSYAELSARVQDLLALLGVEYEFVPAQKKLVRTAAPDTLVPLEDLGKKKAKKN